MRRKKNTAHQLNFATEKSSAARQYAHPQRSRLSSKICNLCVPLCAFDCANAGALGNSMRGDLLSPTHTVGGDPEAFLDYAERQGWGDGLPLIPPTPERVQAMLDYVSEPPEGVIGIIEPQRGTATIEKIAVNAVMAGCKPEHLPVVAAAV